MFDDRFSLFFQATDLRYLSKLKRVRYFLEVSIHGLVLEGIKPEPAYQYWNRNDRSKQLIISCQATIT